MSIIDYRLHRHISILTLNNDDNKINSKFIEFFLKQLDSIEKNTSATTLVVCSSHDRVFSNGIDLEWLNPILKSNNQKKAKDFFFLLNRLFKRILTYPLVTIASINGHAFAGGAILSCAFDFRFMRSDRGFFCLPEIDLGIPFLPGMNEILKKAMSRHLLEYLEYTGARLTAQECKEKSIVDYIYPIDSLLKNTISFAETVNKNRNVTAEIKKRLNADIIKCIETNDAKYIESGNFIFPEKSHRGN